MEKLLIFWKPLVDTSYHSSKLDKINLINYIQVTFIPELNKRLFNHRNAEWVFGIF